MRTAGGVWRTWGKAWVGASAIGVANGALRQVVFKRLDERRAQQVSTATLLAFLTLYMRAVERRCSLPSGGTALRVGAAWAGGAIAFEFALGLLVAGDSVDDLLRAYDLRKGQLWPLVPLWMALGPDAVRVIRTSSCRGGD